MVSRTPPRVTSLIAVLAVVFLLATACGGDSGDSGSPGTSEVPADGETATTVAPEEPPGESAAAGLRSDLTALFEEQVYLTGFTVQAAAADGDLTDPEAAAMAAATAASSRELSDMIGAAYGVAVGADFRVNWDAHQATLVNFGLSDGTPEAVSTARDAVVGVLGAADPEADLTTFASALEASDGEMLITVEELAAGTPAAAVELRAAADEMPAVALSLAEAIVPRIALEGEVDSEESALRAELTGLMQESALLTGLALSETVQADGESSAPGPAGVLAAVEENTEALAAAMEPDDIGAEASFVAIWGDQIDDFVSYATAVVNDDAEGIARADQAIVDFRDELGDLLAGSYPAFTKESVAEELVPHTDSILAFADALVAEADGAEPIESPALLREAALVMRPAARYFTGGRTAPTG